MERCHSDIYIESHDQSKIHGNISALDHYEQKFLSDIIK